MGEKYKVSLIKSGMWTLKPQTRNSLAAFNIDGHETGTSSFIPSTSSSIPRSTAEHASCSIFVDEDEDEIVMY